MKDLGPESERSAAARMADDPVFAALDASGAPILAAAGAPLRIVCANAAAKALFGAEPGLLLEDALQGNGPRLSALAEATGKSGGVRLERLAFDQPGNSAPQLGTVMCRRFDWGGRKLFGLVALGLRAQAAPRAAEKPTPVAAAPEAPRPGAWASVDPEATRALRATLLARHAAAHGAHPRFLWKTDADGRFASVTRVLAEIVGAANADIVGAGVEETVARLGLAPQFQDSLRGGRSWSGVETHWPLERPGDVIPVTLGAMPAYDADRRFTGYLGYGVLRLGEAVSRAAAPAEATAKATSPAPGAPTAEPSDLVETAPDWAENVVPLRPRAPAAEIPAAPSSPPRESEALSDTERDAFDEIARALAAPSTEPPGARDLLARVEREVEQPGAPPLAAMLDALPAAVFVARGSRLLYGNRTLFESLGFVDLDEAQDAGLVTFCDGAAFAEGAPTVAPTGDGAGLPVDAHAQSFDWNGAPARLVTLRRRRDSAPAAAVAADPRAALANSAEALALITPDGAVAAASPAFAKALDAAPQALAGRASDNVRPRPPAADNDSARREAERANAAKSEFLSRLSHEIRTPLSAILGFAEVMREERFGPIGSERYKEYLVDMQGCGEHLLSLVNDLLDLTRIESGQTELAFESVDINAVISESVAIMQPQANQARIVMRLALASRLPRLRADVRSLKQIMLNLLSNALKFTEAGGQVIVSTALLDTGHVVVRVKDTGVGMDDTQKAAMMEAFGPSAARGWSGKGAGIGLPLTKALVEAHHAGLTIQSRKSEGTLVEIAFPPPQELAAE